MYEPFRAALESIRTEFARAGSRHPELFVEQMRVAIPLLHADCPARRKFQSGNEIKKWSNCLSNSG